MLPAAASFSPQRLGTQLANQQPSHTTQLVFTAPAPDKKRKFNNVERGVFAEENYDSEADEAHPVSVSEKVGKRAKFVCMNEKGAEIKFLLSEEVTEGLDENYTPLKQHLDYAVDGTHKRLSDNTFYFQHSREDALEALDEEMGKSLFLRQHKKLLKIAFEYWSSEAYQKSLIPLLDKVVDSRKPILKDSKGRWLPALHVKCLKVKKDDAVGLETPPFIIEFMGSVLPDIPVSCNEMLRWIIGGSAADLRLKEEHIAHEVVAEVLLRLNDTIVYAHRGAMHGALKGYNCCWVKGNAIGVPLKPWKLATKYYKVGAEAVDSTWFYIYGDGWERFCFTGIFTILLLTSIVQKGRNNFRACEPDNMDLTIGLGGQLGNLYSWYGREYPGREYKWAAVRGLVCYRAVGDDGDFTLLHDFIRRNLTVKEKISGDSVYHSYEFSVNAPVFLVEKYGVPETMSFGLPSVTATNNHFARDPNLKMARTRRFKGLDVHIVLKDLEPYTGAVDEAEVEDVESDEE